MSHPPDDFPELPDSLRLDLRAAYGTTPPMPASVDRAVLAAFPRRRLRSNRLYPAIAAAIAATLALSLWYHFEQSAAAPYSPSGDIRDAFYLARQLAAGHTPPGNSWDRNADGRVDQSDVKALALAAVSLTPDPRTDKQ